MQFRNGILHWWDETAIISENGDFHLLHAWNPILKLRTSIGSRIFLALDVSNNPTQFIPDFLEKSNCHGTTNELLFSESHLEEFPKYWWGIANNILWNNFADYHHRGRPKNTNSPPIIQNMKPVIDDGAPHHLFPFWRISYTQGHSFIVLWKIDDNEIIFEKKWYGSSLPFCLSILPAEYRKDYRFICQSRG